MGRPSSDVSWRLPSSTTNLAATVSFLGGRSPHPAERTSLPSVSLKPCYLVRGLVLVFVQENDTLGRAHSTPEPSNTPRADNTCTPQQQPGEPRAEAPHSARE